MLFLLACAAIDPESPAADPSTHVVVIGAGGGEGATVGATTRESASPPTA